MATPSTTPAHLALTDDASVFAIRSDLEWTGAKQRDGPLLHARRPYAGQEDFVLRHGRPFTARQLPGNVPRGWPRACFAIAYQLVASDRELVYVEGFALPAQGGLPTLPACAAERGRQGDPPDVAHAGGLCVFRCALRSAAGVRVG